MKTLSIALLVTVVGLASSALALAPTSATGGYGLSWSVTYSQLPSGQWEYGYDIYSQGHVEYYDYFAMKFDFADDGATTVTDNITNMYDPGTGVMELREFWTVNGTLGNNGGHWWYGGLRTGVQASYGDLSTNSWITDAATIDSYSDAERWETDAVYAAAEGIANPFHTPSDYAVWAGNSAYHTGTTGDAAFGLFPGMQGDEWTAGGSYYTPVDTDLAFDMEYFIGGHMYNGSVPELMGTIRIVSDLGPYGEVSAQFYSSATSSIGTILGPGAVDLLGDFDLDGDVDADDIDLLFANLGSGDTFYDLNDDGVIDQDDVDEWVFNIVPVGGGNVGTVYGDFNLDGAVDAGDLALLGGSFGLAGPFGWANGDATGDGVVDAGDLALLGGNFGTIVHPVPEPVTMSLLALGGVTLLRRRK